MDKKRINLKKKRKVASRSHNKMIISCIKDQEKNKKVDMIVSTLLKKKVNLHSHLNSKSKLRNHNSQKKMLLMKNMNLL